MNESLGTSKIETTPTGKSARVAPGSGQNQNSCRPFTGTKQVFPREEKCRSHTGNDAQTQDFSLEPRPEQPPRRRSEARGKTDSRNLLVQESLSSAVAVLAVAADYDEKSGDDF